MAEPPEPFEPAAEDGQGDGSDAQHGQQHRHYHVPAAVEQTVFRHLVFKENTLSLFF